MHVFKYIGFSVALIAVLLFVHQCSNSKRLYQEVEVLSLTVEGLQKDNKDLITALDDCKEKLDFEIKEAKDTINTRHVYYSKSTVKRTAPKVILKTDTIQILDSLLVFKDSIIYVPVESDSLYTQFWPFSNPKVQGTLKTVAECPVDSAVINEVTLLVKREFKQIERTTNNITQVEAPAQLTGYVGWQAGIVGERAVHGPTAEVDLNLSKFLTISGQYNFLLQQEFPHMIQVKGKLKVFQKKKK